MRRRSLLLGVATLPAWSQKPIRLIVPYAPGGPLDVTARALAEQVQTSLGTVIVENKPGAGGNLGADAVAKAAPDGHTLGIGFNGPLAYAPFLYAKTPYDPAKDLKPIVMTTSQPNVLAVNAALPVKTVKEFVELAKAGKAA